MHESSQGELHHATSQESELPCHDESKDDVQAHCEGSCFCPLLSVNQVPIFELANVAAIVTSQNAFEDLEESAYLRILPPLYRPPIQHS